MCASVYVRARDRGIVLWDEYTLRSARYVIERAQVVMRTAQLTARLGPVVRGEGNRKITTRAVRTRRETPGRLPARKQRGIDARRMPNTAARCLIRFRQMREACMVWMKK